MTGRSEEITRLLVAWSDGDSSALDKLSPVVYAELKRVARRHLANEGSAYTLESAALVNEAFVRLIDWKNVHWQNRAHFFAVSAQLMRRILVDYARSHNYAKRGGGMRPVELDEALAVSDENLSVIIEIDAAMDRLAKMDSRSAEVV